MKKEQFEHTIRAAGAILGVNEVLVIGSQAIHASIGFDLPEVTRSIEVDVSALDDEDGNKADLIDGSIGELSMFQNTFGYYAQGVTPATARLPTGWRTRLLRYRSPNTNGVTAYCLEPHDLWISKAIAGRDKDREYCQALLEQGVVKPKTLLSRLANVDDLSDAIAERVKASILSGAV
ncbi:MAG: DUF6036 family nucleotidyltransferase [Pseudohongiellaceae bacterium]